MPTVEYDVRFRPLTRDDLPLMHDWLSRPHVAQWWSEPVSFDELVREYEPAIDGTVPCCCHLVLLGDEPVGFIQSYTPTGFHHEGWWLDETDPGVRGIDQFLANAHQLARGLGTTMVRAFVATLFADADVTRVHVDPAPDNARAIRCYEKAGFRAARTVDTPDGSSLIMYCERPD